MHDKGILQRLITSKEGRNHPRALDHTKTCMHFYGEDDNRETSSLRDRPQKLERTMIGWRTYELVPTHLASMGGLDACYTS